MDVKLTKINKTELLTIPNPHYETMAAVYPHLEQVVFGLYKQGYQRSITGTCDS